MAFQGTFGLEVTDQGLMTFGSALPFGSAPSLGQPTLVSAMPLGITYQQLKHPAVIDGATYNRARHRMTQVVFSKDFNGKAFVAAKFTDGNTFEYFNGTLVDDSRNGLVLTGLTSLASLGTDVARQVNALTGWAATANVDENGNVVNGSTIAKSPGGVHYVFTPTVVSTNGLQAFLVVDSDQPGTAGVQAVVAFLISNNGTAGVSTFQVTAFKDVGGTIPIDLCNGAITAGANATTTAGLIVTAINENTIFTGYTAVQSGTSVGVYAPLSFASVTFNLTVTATGGTAATTASGVSFVVTATVTPTTAGFTKHNSAWSPSQPSVSATGGTGPYTYQWIRSNSDGSAYSGPSDTVVIVSPSSSKLSISLGTSFNTPAYFKCTVTDSVAATSKVVVRVNISL